MRVTLIAAMDRNRIIGKGDGLPWRLPHDMKRFMRLTLGHHLILGRKTWETLDGPLPGRTNVVITRSIGYAGYAGYAPEGIRIVHSIQEALDLARKNGETEAFVAGGGEIYRQALPLADRLNLTLIEEDFAGDTSFPDYDPAEWTLTEREDHGPTDTIPFAWSYQILDRKA